MQTNDNDNIIVTLQAGASTARCGMYLHNMEGIYRQSIYQDLESQRLNTKYQRIKDRHEKGLASWDNIAFSSILKYLGDMANRQTYEELSLCIDISILQRERESLSNIEALLIAASGLLSTLPKDDFSRQFIANGEYLLHKYQITPLNRSQWRSGVAQCKAPIIRLSQMARIIYNNDLLLNKVINCRRRSDIFDLCSVEASPEISKYFGSPKRHIGADLCDVVAINAVIPLLYAYGQYTSQDSLIDVACNLSEEIPAESNNIISRWRTWGLTPKSSYESQALIELYKNHCSKKSCSKCIIYKHICSPSSEIAKVPALLADLKTTVPK